MIEKKNGVYQHYNIKNDKKFKEKYGYNRNKRAWQLKKPPEPEKPYKPEIKYIPEPPEEVWRLTLCINYIPLHSTPYGKHYYSARLQHWETSEKNIEKVYNDVLKDFYSRIEKEVRADKDNWWFDYTVGKEIRRVYDSTLKIGTDEFEFEEVRK